MNDTQWLDEILNNLAGAPKHRKAGSIIDAKQAILNHIEQDHIARAKATVEALDDMFTKEQILNQVIGVNDTEVRGSTQDPTNPKYWTRRTTARNQLRQELRDKLEKL